MRFRSNADLGSFDEISRSDLAEISTAPQEERDLARGQRSALADEVANLRSTLLQVTAKLPPGHHCQVTALPDHCQIAASPVLLLEPPPPSWEIKPADVSASPLHHPAELYETRA